MERNKPEKALGAMPARAVSERFIAVVIGVMMGAALPLCIVLIRMAVVLLIPADWLVAWGGAQVPIMAGSVLVYGAVLSCGPVIAKRWLRSAGDSWLWGVGMGCGSFVGLLVFLYVTGALKHWPPQGEKHEIAYWLLPCVTVHSLGCRIAWQMTGTKHLRHESAAETGR